MTKETVQAQGSKVVQECVNANCVIAAGSAVGADYIVKGSINKVGSKFSLSVEMYETKDGNLEASLTDPIRSEKIMDLIEKISAGCAAMYTKFVSEQNPPPAYQQQANQQPQPTPPTPQPQPQPQPPAPTPPPPPAVNVSTFTDKRDGKTYKTVTIGGKRWMGENLNYQTDSGSWCYGGDKSNCDKYGRLYDWNTAMTACPKDWRLPTREDWRTLVDYAGGLSAGKALKSPVGWNGGGNGEGKYGFGALPGGVYGTDGYFYNVGAVGYWWTSTEDESGGAYRRDMHYDGNAADENGVGKGNGYSVRCVRE